MRILRVAAVAAGGLLLLSQLVPAQATGGPSYRWECDADREYGAVPRVVGGQQGRGLGRGDPGSGAADCRRRSKHWQNVSPAGAEALQFRDVQAFDAKRAVILSIGPAQDSRIYRTANGGKTWTETFRNTDANAFYDCMAFNGGGHGLALSDPVDGKFRIAATSDGGKSWKVQPNAGMPAALPGEFAFAASGTCLVAGPGRTAWFATGGGERPRVFRTFDGGRHWTVANSPMASGEAAGIFSLAFRGSLFGVAVGGDFLKPTEAVKAASVTYDGGRTWKLVPADKAPKGYRSGSHLRAVVAAHRDRGRPVGE